MMRDNYKTVCCRHIIMGFGLCLLLILFMFAGIAWAAQVEGETTRVHTVEYGQTADGIIVLRSNKTAPEWVRLYLTDHSNDVRTGWQFPAAGTLERSGAQWIDLMQTEVLLQPGETRSVFYRISVPADPKIQGTYWCSLMIEPQSAKEIPVEAGKPEEGKFTLALRQVIRSQIALIINVGNTGEKSLAFLEPNLDVTDDGTVNFSILMENTGERWLNPEVWMEIYDNIGGLVSRIEAGKTRILPGAAVKRQFNLIGIEPGDYQALVFVDDGGDNIFGTMFTLRLTPM